jgi:putative serine protease PepD
MPRRPRHLPLIATLLATTCIGAGGGALAYATLSSSSDGGTKTVVRQVTVNNSQPISDESGLTVNQIYRRSYKGVVQIMVSTEVASPLGGSERQGSEGSGFVYDANGDIVTNQHVVAGARSIKVTFWNGKTAKAKVIGTDPSTDLAVIRVSVPSSQLNPLALGDSSAVQVGDGVVAIGSPFGLAETVTSGIVSALHRTITSPNQFTISDSIQTDAAINHGNSGGPLLNAQGRVIGVNAQIHSETAGGGNEGVGFSIPSNTVRSVVPQLISSGKAEHAYLGVSIDSTAVNARIAGVRSGTPAKHAGLKAGDVVTELGGRSVSTGDELASAIAAHKPGDTLQLTYRRDGESHTVTVTLATRPS